MPPNITNRFFFQKEFSDFTGIAMQGSFPNEKGHNYTVSCEASGLTMLLISLRDDAMGLLLFAFTFTCRSKLGFVKDLQTYVVSCQQFVFMRVLADS